MDSSRTKQPLSKLLGEMAVLATVNASALGLTRLDKQASAEFRPCPQRHAGHRQDQRE